MRRKCRAMPESLFAAEIGLDPDSEKILSDVFNDQTKPIHNIVLLRMTFNGKGYRGTGTIIHRSLDSLFILTCAHNVVQIKQKMDMKN